MSSVEQVVKQQFARVFVVRDWTLFKRMADHYLRTAARLRRTDIEIAPPLKLLARNCQKRLFIGIGTELLLKAIYLKEGFSINKLENGQAGAPRFPFKFQQVAGFRQLDDQTYMLNELVQKLHTVPSFAGLPGITRGLTIAKVFRNKEGHGVVDKHTFDLSNYRDIEAALVVLYTTAFGEKLHLRFSVAHGEKAVWRVAGSLCAKKLSQRMPGM